MTTKPAATVVFVLDGEAPAFRFAFHDRAGDVTLTFDRDYSSTAASYFRLLHLLLLKVRDYVEFDHYAQNIAIALPAATDAMREWYPEIFRDLASRDDASWREAETFADLILDYVFDRTTAPKFVPMRPGTVYRLVSQLALALHAHDEWVAIEDADEDD